MAYLVTRALILIQMAKRGRKFDPERDTTHRTVNSMKALAAILKCPNEWIRQAVNEGVGNTSSGRYRVEPVRQWIEANQDKLQTVVDKLPLKEQKTAEEVRKLKIANDLKAGRLIERSWVNERFQKLGGEINAIRSKSEAEDAMRFGEAAGDIAKCRTVLRGIWDEIFTRFGEAGKHFEA